MTNTQALTALYVALGGNEETIAGMTNADIIFEISKIIVPLPAVSATENGKVLKVVNGKWAVGTDAVE